jgi:5-methylcytosine-specific restriction protein A
VLDVPFELGALYNRAAQIHSPFGGQQRGGISTPSRSPFVFIFTGESGKSPRLRRPMG